MSPRKSRDFDKNFNFSNNKMVLYNHGGGSELLCNRLSVDGYREELSLVIPQRPICDDNFVSLHECHICREILNLLALASLGKAARLSLFEFDAKANRFVASANDFRLTHLSAAAISSIMEFWSENFTMLFRLSSRLATSMLSNDISFLGQLFRRHLLAVEKELCIMGEGNSSHFVGLKYVRSMTRVWISSFEILYKLADQVSMSFNEYRWYDVFEKYLLSVVLSDDLHPVNGIMEFSRPYFFIFVWLSRLLKCFKDLEQNELGSSVLFSNKPADCKLFEWIRLSKFSNITASRVFAYFVFSFLGSTYSTNISDESFGFDSSHHYIWDISPRFMQYFASSESTGFEHKLSNWMQEAEQKFDTEISRTLKIEAVCPNHTSICILLSHSFFSTKPTNDTFSDYHNIIVEEGFLALKYDSVAHLQEVSDTRIVETFAEIERTFGILKRDFVPFTITWNISNGRLSSKLKWCCSCRLLSDDYVSTLGTLFSWRINLDIAYRSCFPWVDQASDHRQNIILWHCRFLMLSFLQHTSIILSSGKDLPSTIKMLLLNEHAMSELFFFCVETVVQMSIKFSEQLVEKLAGIVVNIDKILTLLLSRSFISDHVAVLCYSLRKTMGVLTKLSL